MKKKLKRYEGHIQIGANEIGFVKVDSFKDSIKIESRFLNKALNNDLVEICLLPSVGNEKKTGEVLAIKERARNKFVGTIKRKSKKDSFGFLIPDDKRMYRNIFIPHLSKNAKNGYKAVVKFLDWKDEKEDPKGEIERIIGKKGNIDVEMHSIIYENNLVVDFPKKVLDQAKKIKKSSSKILNQELKKRRDLRNTITFTIDPDDAKDFDDALSYRSLKGGDFELGLHIADVSSYVKKGTAIDREAQKRAFSIYLVDRTIPMLPEVLSNDLCSLNEKEDKLAYSVILTMNKEGRVKRTWFGQTIINSNRRFNYQEAQEIIDKKKGKFSKELQFLNEVAKKIRKKRFQEGAIDFDRAEIKFELDKKGVPIKIHTKKRLDTHKLIEEFMVLANNEVAKFLGKNKVYTCLYRVHDNPKKDFTDNFVEILKDLGYSPKVKKGTLSAKEMNNILDKTAGKPEELLVNTLMLRTMSKAKYSVDNIGHYGLSLKYYTHFTSPIRRYSDLAIHRILTKKIEGKKLLKKEKKEYKELAEEISQTELKVAQAQYASIEMKQIEYMVNNANRKYEGIISSIKKFGIFVKVLDTQAEGLIHVSELRDDFYDLDKNMHALIGRKTGKKYTIGDKVKVRVDSGDLERKELNLLLVK